MKAPLRPIRPVPTLCRTLRSHHDARMQTEPRVSRVTYK